MKGGVLSVSSLARPHPHLPPDSPPCRPSSSGGGRDDWLPVTIVAARSGKSRDTVGGLVQRGKIRAIRTPASGRGYQYLVHWPTAELFLRSYVPSRSWTRSGGPWSGPPCPETIARFNEVWDRFVRGECGPLGYARPGAGKTKGAA